jgi:hypothetical protein
MENIGISDYNMASIEMSDHWDKGISYYTMVNIGMSDYWEYRKCSDYNMYGEERDFRLHGIGKFKVTI